ncbi:MAG: ABC transporter substrate-binding protein [Myxococcota bacterium]|nr:ABC transporter substrate-binding protein [Myxococcota bacterium]
MRSIRATFEGIALAATATALTLFVPPLGCTPSFGPPIPTAHPGDVEPRRGGTLRLASFQDIGGLDPAGPTDGLAFQAERLIFAGLVDYDETGALVPDLAARWDVEDEGRAYRFVMRRGVIMQDGEELTADDVRRAAERALHPSAPNPSASYMENISGYDDYLARRADHLRGIVVESRYVVSFRLAQPDATFLSLLAMPMLRPVCKSAGDRYLDSWTPCGAGPFKLAPGGWQRGMSLRLQRHRDYFRAGLPYLDEIEWSFNLPLFAQRLRFQRGDLDVLRDMTRADQARFLADERWRALGSNEPDTNIYGESMNTRMAPFDNVEVRRAVATAVDREHYKALKPAAITVVTQPLPPGVPGYDETAVGQHYDYAAALDHMRKAGYAYDPLTGAGGWPRPIVYPVYDQGLLVSTAQLLQQDLSKIGLRLELKVVSWSTFLALQHRPGAVAISQASWEMDYPDASSFFDPLFTTASINPEASFNTAFYSNPPFDALVARAHREIDPTVRRGLYRDATAILVDDAPWAFAYSYHFFVLRQAYVRGLAKRAIGAFDPTRAWVDRPQGEWRRRPLGYAP